MEDDSERFATVNDLSQLNDLPRQYIRAHPHFGPFSLLKNFHSPNLGHIGPLCHYTIYQLYPVQPSASLKTHFGGTVQPAGMAFLTF